VIDDQNLNKNVSKFDKTFFFTSIQENPEMNFDISKSPFQNITIEYVYI